MYYIREHQPPPAYHSLYLCISSFSPIPLQLISVKDFSGTMTATILKYDTNVGNEYRVREYQTLFPVKFVSKISQKSLQLGLKKYKYKYVV